MRNWFRRELNRSIRYLVRLLFPVVSSEIAKIHNTNSRRLIEERGMNFRIANPHYIIGGEYISIGDDFSAGPGLRMEALDHYGANQYSPTISIGNNVHISFYTHIGAIDKISIGDNVLIGSHVLITDHQHGNASAEMLNTIYVDAPLVSKGPVIIEDNVWIGEGVCVLPGVHIGKNAILGANAVITNDVLPGQVMGGVPAKVLFNISERDKP